jgi:heterodisulfide reductase subunit A-like polyferredoxin
MTRLEAVAPGLLIGGHCRDGISLGDSIASGQQMAEKAQQFLEQLTPKSEPMKNYASSAKSYV